MKRRLSGSTLNTTTEESSESHTKAGMGQRGSKASASRGYESISDVCSGQQSAVPLPVVEKILLNLPGLQVVRVCRLVCHEWKELVDSAAHWKARCRREQIQPCDPSRTPEDWCQFYILAKKRCNLIMNPKAEDGLQGWEIVEHSGDSWETDECRKPFPDNTVTRCFIPTRGLCLKRQLIDLQKEGYSAAFMDQMQPYIKISDWYTSDSRSQYNVTMTLLDEAMNSISTYHPYKMFQDGGNYPWCEITRVFRNYGPGVRFIRFTHGGWSHNRLRLTNSSVEVCPAAERLRCTKPNLLMNPSAKDGLQGWKMVHSGSGCWVTTKNSEPLLDTVTKCFMTSYGLCLKRQLIDLQNEGYSNTFMDLVQPHIQISDWYAPCWDCGSEYQICVELLDQEMKPISTFKPEKVLFHFGNSEAWCQMAHVFKNYGPGVRFISFTHGGKDTHFWAGHYGIRVTNSSVEICPADNSSFIIRNLIKNPSARDAFQGWDIIANGGHLWQTGGTRQTFPVNTCFATSYGLCLKQQLIDLQREGYSDAFMDQKQPHIKISDWYAPRSDCGSEYQICVELLNQKMNPICTFQPRNVFFQQGGSYSWRQITHIFKNYGPGVRFIRFTHGGKDTKFKEDCFGIQVTNSSVEICPTD